MARLVQDRRTTRRPTTDSNTTFTRTTFETSRLLEFFTESELQMQIGHAQELWPLALLKELIDNALDACESADVHPDLDVEVTADRIRVRDNGPGLPLATLERSLAYEVRVSDKSFYVSPTRGQLGNALKCVYAAPFVVDGQQGRVEVATGGQRHTITIRLDRLSQKPVLEMATTRGHVKTGTEVVLHWKDVASSFRRAAADEFYMAARGSIADPRDLISRYAVFNPHLRIRYQDQRSRRVFTPTIPAWRKWQPNHPTSPHWYTPDRFRGLLAAYITADRAHGRSRTVREVVAEFAGLSGTAKQKLVTGAVGLTGARLDDLVVDGDLAMDRVTALLRAMQQHSRPIKPVALGVIGAGHLRQRMVENHGVTEDSFNYARQAGTTATGVPWVVETALAVRADDRPRQLLCGVNFSALVEAEMVTFVTARLSTHRIDPHDPLVVVVHLVNPRVRFSDRGKSILALEDEDEAAGIEAGIIKAIDAVVPKLWKHAKRRADAEDRVRPAALGRFRYPPANAISIREAAFTFMEEAYFKASSNGTLPANARQIMYCVRPLVISYLQDAGCERTCWTKSSYFTQVLLPAYIEEHPEAAAWDIVFDARGHLVEPHTCRQVGLGTLDVRGYIARWADVPETKLPKLGLRYPTHGPTARYRAVLFVEKEGFQPLFEHVDLAERFDVAIMSTKGMSVTAARQLVEALSERSVPIFVIRDFDKAGFSIVHTLSHDTRRYTFSVTPKVIDLGLRLADVQAMGLASEPVEYSGRRDPSQNLRACGATEEECAFLVTEQGREQWSGARVELNAMTSEQLVAWVERKLRAHGLTTKLVPDRTTLEHAYRRAARLIPIQRMLTESDGPDVRVPRDLRKRVADFLARHPRTSWDRAVYRLVKREFA